MLLVELSAPDKLKLRYKERLSNKTDPIKRTGTSVQEVDLEVDPTGPPVHFANQKKLVSDPLGLVVQTGDRREDGMGATVLTPLHNQAAEVVESVSRNNSHAVDLGIVTDEAMLQEVTSKLRSEASASSNSATIHQASFSAALRSADSVKENQNASAQSSPSASLIAKQSTSGDANNGDQTETSRSPCSKSESGTREDRALREDHSSSQDKKVQAPSSLMGGLAHHVKPTHCVHADPATTTGPVNNLKDETTTQGNSSLSSRSTSLVHHHGYRDKAEYRRNVLRAIRI